MVIFFFFFELEAKKVFLKVSTRPKMACTNSWYNELRALPPFFSLPSPMQEITLWRKGDVVRKSMSHQAVIASQRFEGSAASESALEQAAKEESG